MGGRGGSSGLSGAGTKLPTLQGSEKQVAWANDIRGSATNISEMSEHVLNYAKYKQKEENARAAGNTDDIIKATRETGRARAAMATVEHFVSAAHGNKQGFLSSTKDSFFDRSFEKYPKGSKEFKDTKAKAREKQNREYRKWLVDEYKKVLKSQTSAKWWIDNR